MTPKQRFLTAVAGGTPDAVAVSPLIHARFAHRLISAYGWRDVYRVHRLIGTVHFRGPLGVGFDFEWPEGWGDDDSLELGEDGRVIRQHTVRTPFGDLSSTYVNNLIPGDPLVGKYVVYPVKEPEQWTVYQRLTEKLTELAVRPDLEGVRQAHRVMGEEGVPSVGVGSVFGRLGNQRGMAELLLDLYDHPSLIASVYDTTWQYQERVLQAFLDSPSEVCFYDICWATGARMGPKLFEKWVGPEIRRAVELVHRRPGKYVGFYTLGRIRELLPVMVDTGVDFIETFEPNEGDITLAEAKRLYGKRTCLMGNFDCLVLARGSREEARQETLRCLQEGMDGGGYVLVTADEVPADARLDNLKVMAETADRHGHY